MLYRKPGKTGVDISEISLDAAEHALNENVTAEYGTLTKKASDCTECGVCVERCPFDVPVLDRMERAIQVFGY